MDILNSLPSGWTGVGAVLGLIGGGAIFLRQYLSGAEASRASDQGQIAALDVYKQMVGELRSLLDAERSRADQFAKERNEAISLLSEYKAQIAELSRRVEAQSAEIRTLRQQLEGLNHDKV